MQYLFSSATYHLSNVCARFIWNINTMQVLLERWCSQMYNNYSIVRNINYYYHSMWWILFPKPHINLLREPEESDWITLSTNDHDDIHTSVQTFEEEPTLDTFKCEMDISAKTLLNLKNKNCCCLIGKYSEHYFVQVSDILPKLKFRESDVTLLSIYYYHPSMAEKIALKIPDGMYHVGNELLNANFVLRTLKMQSEPFVFDEGYEIQCMDSNIAEFSISWDQYIRVNYDTFDIITIIS